MDTQQHIPSIMHRTFPFFLLPFFLLLLLLPSCGRQGGTAQALAPAGDTVPLRYATGFDIVRHGHYRELLVYNPWQPGAVLARYYLAGDDTTAVPPDGTRLRTPLRHVALTSVTHVEFMRLAGVLDRVDGLCSPRLAYNATLRSRAEAGDLADLGDSFALNVERALALRPQAVEHLLLAELVLCHHAGIAFQLVGRVPDGLAAHQRFVFIIRQLRGCGAGIDGKDLVHIFTI